MATQADIISHLVSKIWGTLPNPASPEGQAALETIHTKITPFSNSIMYDYSIVAAAKVVNNVETDQEAWWSLWTGVQQWPDATGRGYFQSIMEQAGSKKRWREQSAIAAGRRPTILTSGRGAAGTPALALTKLKKQLGK